MGLTVINPGLFTTVQDLGRIGYRAFGVSLGGVFDRGSASLANALVGNDASAAVLELTLIGGTFRADQPLALAIAGATMSAMIVREQGAETGLSVPSSVSLAPGDRLELGAASTGARAYLAVRGGWQTPVVLGSRSSEAPLHAGDILPCDSSTVSVRRPSPELISFAAIGTSPLRVIAGPDAGLIDREMFATSEYRLGPRSNRMGLRLEGPHCDVQTDPDRISTPIAPGAVQVAGGQLLVLGVACGTMGGYPHVAHVISADLDRLAQARPGEIVRFLWVSLDDARRLDHQSRQSIARTRTRVALAVANSR